MEMKEKKNLMKGEKESRRGMREVRLRGNKLKEEVERERRKDTSMKIYVKKVEENGGGGRKIRYR